MVPEAPLEVTDSGVGRCVVLAMSSRENQALGPYGAYTVDEAARRHGTSPEEETRVGDVAYANVPESEPTCYHDGWLPGYARD